jgi:pre-mRNA-splicing helicase BRR2
VAGYWCSLLFLICPISSRKKPRRESEEHFTSKGYLTSEVEGGLSGPQYRPRTKETRSSYEMLLSFVQQMIGDQVWRSV